MILKYLWLFFAITCTSLPTYAMRHDHFYPEYQIDGIDPRRMTKDSTNSFKQYLQVLDLLPIPLENISPMLAAQNAKLRKIAIFEAAALQRAQEKALRKRQAAHEERKREEERKRKEEERKREEEYKEEEEAKVLQDIYNNSLKQASLRQNPSHDHNSSSRSASPLARFRSNTPDAEEADIWAQCTECNTWKIIHKKHAQAVSDDSFWACDTCARIKMRKKSAEKDYDKN